MYVLTMRNKTTMLWRIRDQWRIHIELSIYLPEYIMAKRLPLFQPFKWMGGIPQYSDSSVWAWERRTGKDNSSHLRIMANTWLSGQLYTSRLPAQSLGFTNNCPSAPCAHVLLYDLSTLGRSLGMIDFPRNCNALFVIWRMTALCYDFSRTKVIQNVLRLLFIAFH
jgi:hypothetical protein